MVLVGFATMEDRSLYRHDAEIEAAKDHAVGDVRGIEDVMRERSERILRARRAMHERDRSERRFTHGGAGEREAAARSERHTPRCRELHEEIVRVLVIGDLQTLVGFADLKDLRVTAPGSCQWLHGYHAREAK